MVKKNNYKIKCACGCGKLRDKYDKKEHKTILHVKHIRKKILEEEVIL